jgi:hypothetical protein
MHSDPLSRLKFLGLVVVMSVLLSQRGYCQVSDSPENLIPPRLTKAVGCLVAADFVQDLLKSLGLHIGDRAWVQYHIGPAPGTSQSSDLVYVAVYSSDDRRGWLLIAEPNDRGGFIALRNAYQLSRENNHWRADEGNGGIATYKAMSQFATDISRSRRYLIPLVKGSAGCTTSN